MLSLSKQKIQPFRVAEVLEEKGVVIFSPSDFSRLFQVSPRQTRYFLEAYTKRGFLARLKKDFYALKSRLPFDETIANAIYRPSYISLEYALSYYGIIPESAYSITSVTTKTSAAFSVQGKEFLYRKIKKDAYTGYVPIKSGDKTVLFAEPEKALVDFLYFVSLGRKGLNDRVDCARLDKAKAIGYAKLFKRKNLVSLLEQVWDAEAVEIK
jgi:predicted transcriptional regulator of viral defense system